MLLSLALPGKPSPPTDAPPAAPAEAAVPAR
jgi:hypothetical protein